MTVPSTLPIESVLDPLRSALRAHPAAVLVAPPGAGKTTRVPLALLGEDWAAGGKLIVLEPRRLAARAAAERMAETLDEPLGGTIGLRARFDTAVSGRTRIEVVTEGVFTRMVLDDPELSGVAGVIFDEYHERSLDADLGLALGLDAAAALRPDLRLLVMSATLDGARVAALLEGAEVIRSEGRAYPVETRYLGRAPDRRIEDAVADAVVTALRSEPGSILAFLPGQAEILRTAALLDARLRAGEAEVAPLYGALDRAVQDRAVRPAPDGRRKIVLATSIAESALTIEGVRVVIDSGLARVPRFEPDLGLTRLETVRASRASCDQRRGRAGRTGPGLCFRLWEEAATGALPAYARPEILDADLSGLVLDLARSGIRDPGSLRWLDPPPVPALLEARKLLGAIGAFDAAGDLTDAGRAMARLAAPPRIARMVIEAERRGAGRLGGEVATLLVERGLGGTGAELGDRLERWRRDRGPRATAARRLAETFARQARNAHAPGGPDGLSPGQALALAFPERIAKARGRTGEFLLANGRAAAVDAASPLARAAFLAVGELTGRAAASRILLAEPLTFAEVESVAGADITQTREVTFEAGRAALAARHVTRLGAIVLGERPLPPPDDEAAAAVLARGLGTLGLDRLPWTRALGQWRDRVAFLRQAEGEAWPDLGDAALRQTIETWLGPALLGKAGLADLAPGEVGDALQALLPYDLSRRLEAEAPTHWVAPTGSAIAVDYAAEGGAGHRGAGAGTLRAGPPSGPGRRPRAADAQPVVAGAPPDPDHPATCRGFGAGPGLRSAPRCAAATPAIPGPKTPRPRRRPRAAKPRGT